MVVLVPGLLALVFGWFAFRIRVTGVYLSIITQAMTYALLLAFFRNDMGFGGNNGMTDFKDMLGFAVQADDTRAVLCFASALALAIFLVSAAAIVGSRFGKVLIAVRDAESRMRFLGYRVERLQAVRLRAVGGAWPASPARSTCRRSASSIPASSRPANSIEAVIWVAVGGRGTLVGRGHRRLHRQFRQDLAHRRAAGDLAVRAGRAVHRRHAVPAQGRRRPVARSSRTARRRRARRGPRHEGDCA